MADIKSITISVQLRYSDNVVVTLGSNDIKNKDDNIFTDEELGQIIMECSEQLAELIENKTTAKMHREAKLRDGICRRPDNWKKPFSDN